MKPLLLLIFVAALSAFAAELVDDRQITITTAPEAAARRDALIKHLWGAEGLPKKLPLVLANIPAPVKSLTNLARVDELRFDLATNLKNVAWHFIPDNPKGELVIVHHGHACTLDDDSSPNDVGYGLQRTINALLREGYSVLGAFMPHMRPGDCGGDHNALVQAPTTGSGIKYFLEPIAISLNYLKSQSQRDNFPNYRAYHMTGLSGGGWTTTIYAAIDPTIQVSIPIAGTIPLYLRTGGSVGDAEQSDTAFYKLAGYPDLYVLGSHGEGRRQIQVLIEKDDCCFGQGQHDEQKFGQSYIDSIRAYESKVQSSVKKMGGHFKVQIDQSAPSHMISHATIERVLLTALRQSQFNLETIAGTGNPGFSGDNGPADKAEINNPYGLTMGPQGALYFCDMSNHRIRKIDSKGVITTVAGNGQKGWSGDGSPALQATLNEPYEIRFDRNDDMYFVEMRNHLIRRMDAKTGLISTVAGQGKPGFAGDGGSAATALFNQPHSIQFVGDDLWVCDIGNHRIRKIDFKTGLISTVGGTGEKAATRDGEILPGNALNGPRAIDVSGNTLWLALREGNAICKVDLTTQRIRRVITTGLAGPKGITIAPNGWAIWADTESHSIKYLDPQNNSVQTLAENLKRPHGVYAHTDGKLYIGDSENHRILRVKLP